MTEAARALRCDRKTVARYIRRHKRLQVIRSEVVEQMTDLAESRLHKPIDEGDGQTIRGFLSRMARGRGYRDRVEHSGRVDATVSHSAAAMDPDAAKRLLRQWGLPVIDDGDTDERA